MKRIRIFDTTLRDGEQSPGCSMNMSEKIEMAKQLERMKVDVIEAGFAIASPGDFESIRKVAATVSYPAVCSLARLSKLDIDRAWEAVMYAKKPMIHVFIATSAIHMEYKLKMTPDEVLATITEMVGYASSKCPNIEFSCEDATRSDPEFAAKAVDAAIKAGATTINLPDTVGYTTPDEYREFITKVTELANIPEDVVISAHCHNDLGMGVANSLAAIKAGVSQIECTVNGIGERAGNSALEEIVMAIKTRSELYNAYTDVESKEIMRSSRLLSSITGINVQPNKAIVGVNAFAHEAGIHQHGFLANRETYEIMTPESVGVTETNLVLGKHSGKHAFRSRVKHLGYTISEEALAKAFAEFKILCDRKKQIFDRDIEAILDKGYSDVEPAITLESFIINSGKSINATSAIKIKYKGVSHEAVSFGDGPVDASFKAIDSVVQTGHILDDYRVRAITEGEDAQGEAAVKIKYNNKLYNGRGLSTDVIESSIMAYIDAINRMIAMTEMEAKSAAAAGENAELRQIG